jgi:hypothetical protein
MKQRQIAHILREERGTLRVARSDSYTRTFAPLCPSETERIART